MDEMSKLVEVLPSVEETWSQKILQLTKEMDSFRTKGACSVILQATHLLNHRC